MGLIYLDSCLVIYLIEQHPVFAPMVQATIANQTANRLAISGLTKMECLVKPMRTADLALQRRYEAGFCLYQPLELPEPVFLLSAQLRARFGLKTPDALHLACAQFHGCAALWTNDDRLARAGHGLAVNILAP